MGIPVRPERGGGEGARGIVLLVVALVLGVVLLQKLDHGSGALPGSSGGPTLTTIHRTTTTTRRPTVSALATTTTRPLRTPDQVKVLPANATNTVGLATTTGNFLRSKNYNALAPTDATKKLDNTLIEYKADFEPEARVLATLLQLPATSVREIEASPPVADSSAADILLIAGADLRLPTTTSTTK